MTTFSFERIPAQSGRTFVVTGANSGIGRVAAAVLADKGARVVLAVRDPAKGEAAASDMTGDVTVERLDLADLASVRDFAERFTEPVDVLINNAGIMIPPLRRTVDGFESQFGTNHLGHFALTNLLLPRVRDRVVTVSSQAHRGGAIDFDDLNWEHKRYRATAAYGQSKLANLLFTLELQRRLVEVGSPVLATAAHPGFAATNLLRPDDRGTWSQRALAFFVGLTTQPEADGALPSLHAAVAEVPGNSYSGPRFLFESRGAPKLVARSARARDTETARRLWDVSTELTGVTFPEPALRHRD